MLVTGLFNRTVKGTVTKSCLCKRTERVFNCFFLVLKTYNRTSCRLILSVIILVINKSDSRSAVVQFCQSFVSLSLIFKRKKKDLRSCCRDQRSLSVYYSHTGTPLLVEQSTRFEMKYEQFKIVKESFCKLLVCKRFDYWSNCCLDNHKLEWNDW